MANTQTAAPTNAASAIVDEAVRITADNSRRSAEAAQAAVGAGQRFLDVATQINRDLFSVWTNAAEANLQTTFEVQNAVLANSQTVLTTSAKLGQDALSRWVDLARQAQVTTLKSVQSSTKLFGTVTHAS